MGLAAAPPAPVEATEPTPAEASEPAPEPEAEIVTLYGSILLETKDTIAFLVCYGDDAGTEAEFEIPKQQVIMLVKDEGEEQQDTITLYRAYAIAAEIIAAPDEAGQEHGCHSCRYYSSFDGDCDAPEGHECNPDEHGKPTGWKAIEKSCSACAHLNVEGDTACESCGDDLLNFAPVPPATAPAQGHESAGQAQA